jgi:hypothetical protein
MKCNIHRTKQLRGFTIDDNAWGNRRTATGVATNTVVQRFFSIKMRNY